MKCHPLSLAVLLATAALALADKTVDVAEHRAAKPEPFLDRLASALFGSTNEKKSDNNKQPQRPKPVYKRPPPQVQQALPSFQTPVVAARPQSGYGPPRAPPITQTQKNPLNNGPPRRPPSAQYKPAASNSFPSYFGSGGGNGGPQPGRN